jgi:DNA-binding NtrC family response regulator
MNNKPLREWVSEIPGLARLFLDRACGKNGRLPPALSPAVVGMLERHAWAGDIQELELVIEQALSRCEGREILSKHLRPGWWQPERVSTSSQFEPAGQREIFAALAASAGCRERAAKLLGLPRRAMLDAARRNGVSGVKSKPP